MVCKQPLKLQEPASSSDTLDSVKPERFQVLNVDEDCNLRFFVKSVHGLKYEARRFFFEFVSREEEVTDDKEIILLDKVNYLTLYLYNIPLYTQ